MSHENGAMPLSNRENGESVSHPENITMSLSDLENDENLSEVELNKRLDDLIRGVDEFVNDPDSVTRQPWDVMFAQMCTDHEKTLSKEAKLSGA